jgi:peroxiredoxin
MRNTLVAFAVAASLAIAGAARADDKDHKHDHPAHVGEKAPAFSLQDQNGKQVTLSDLSGKIVVLEWINPGCPFVVRLGKEQAMKNLADKYKDKDVVWLGVIPGDGATAAAAKKWAQTAGLEYPILLDTSTSVSRSYGAKATPHMFVIDKSGKLAYSGAIDNDPEGEKPANERTNYVAQAIDALVAGQTVATPETKAYGCGVKYK